MSIPTAFLTARPAAAAGGRPGSGTPGDGGTGFGSALQAAVAGSEAAPGSGTGTTTAQSPAGSTPELREETEIPAEAVLPAAGFIFPAAEPAEAASPPAPAAGIPADGLSGLPGPASGGTEADAGLVPGPAGAESSVETSAEPAPLPGSVPLTGAASGSPDVVGTQPAPATAQAAAAAAGAGQAVSSGASESQDPADPAPERVAGSAPSAPSVGGAAGAKAPEPVRPAAVPEEAAPATRLVPSTVPDVAAAPADGAEPAAAPAAGPATTAPATPAPGVPALQIQPAPVQTVASPPVQAPAAQAAPLLTQVAQPLFSLTSAAPGEHVMTLSITPENLGPVTVRAHVSADGIRVELFAPNDAGREALRTILTDLRRDLSGSGLNTSLSLSAQDQPGNGADSRGERTGTPPGGERATEEPGAGPVPVPQNFRAVAHGAVSTLDILA